MKKNNIIFSILLLFLVIILCICFKYYFFKCEFAQQNILEGFSGKVSAGDTTTTQDTINHVGNNINRVNNEILVIMNSIVNNKDTLETKKITMLELFKKLENAKDELTKLDELYKKHLKDRSGINDQQVTNLEEAAAIQKQQQAQLDAEEAQRKILDQVEQKFNEILTRNFVNLWLTTLMYDTNQYKYVTNDGFVRRNNSFSAQNKIDSWIGMKIKDYNNNQDIGYANNFSNTIVYEKGIYSPEKANFTLPKYYFDSSKETFFVVMKMNGDPSIGFGVLLLACADESNLAVYQGRTVSIGANTIGIGQRNNGRGVIGVNNSRFPMNTPFLMSFSIDYSVNSDNFNSDSKKLVSMYFNGKPLQLQNGFEPGFKSFSQPNQNKPSCILSYRPTDETYYTKIPTLIYEMIGFNGVKMNDTDMDYVNAYLMNKWKITANYTTENTNAINQCKFNYRTKDYSTKDTYYCPSFKPICSGFIDGTNWGKCVTQSKAPPPPPPPPPPAQPICKYNNRGQLVSESTKVCPPKCLYDRNGKLDRGLFSGSYSNCPRNRL